MSLTWTRPQIVELAFAGGRVCTPSDHSPGLAQLPRGSIGSTGDSIRTAPASPITVARRGRQQQVLVRTPGTSCPPALSRLGSHSATPGRQGPGHDWLAAVLAGLVDVRGWQEGLDRDLHAHPELSHQSTDRRDPWPTRCTTPGPRRSEGRRGGEGGGRDGRYRVGAAH